jgi:hypothetical protein
MGLKIKLIAFVLGLVFFGVVLRSVRQNSFRPLYAVLWLSLSGFLLSIAIFEPFYKWFATSVIGINDARHVIYIAVISFLLVYNLYLTATVSRMSNQIRHLISAVAILESKLQRPLSAPPPRDSGDPLTAGQDRSSA